MNENKLLQAIDAIRTGKPQTAQVLLAQILKDDINQDSAWVWMASLQDDPVRKMQCLERALKANPDNVRAKQMVADLASGTVEKPEDNEPVPLGEYEPVQPTAESFSPPPFNQVQDQTFTPFQPVQATEKAHAEPEPEIRTPEPVIPVVEKPEQVVVGSASIKARPAQRILPSERKTTETLPQPEFDAERYRSLAQTKSRPGLSGLNRSQMIVLVVLGLLTLIMIVAVIAVIGMTFKIF